ncbi:MAG: ASCH domain-containing protein [Promethearchaeota archaeon]
MKEERILHLNLKKKWFDMIAYGEKKEEYREIKEYWNKRLVNKIITEYDLDDQEILYEEYVFENYTHIIFSNGYRKYRPQIKIKLKKILIETGKEKWGAEKGKEYFVLKLGKVECLNKECQKEKCKNYSPNGVCNCKLVSIEKW